MILDLSDDRARGATPGFRRLRRAIAIAVTPAFCLIAGGAQAIPVYFEWASISAGTAGGITATVDSTIVSGDFGTDTVTATDPGFVAAFGASVPVLDYGAPISNTSGDVRSEITFSEALPSGSLLMAFDMDWRGETFLLQSDLGFPTLLEQGATLAGATPTLPDYDMATGLLSETAPDAFPNIDEFSLFDLSGATSLIANYSGGSLDSTSRIAIGVPSGDTIPPVPAPATLPLLFSVLAFFGGITGGRRATPRS